MGRPKGSKNKIKKVVKNNSTRERVKQLNVKRGRPVIPKHVLKLTDWLYITCDAHCWMIKEVNDKINPVTGEKYPDKSLLFAGTLDGILKVAVGYMIRVPADVSELTKKLHEIHSLIDSRIPPGIKPKNLFEVYQVAKEDDEE